ncbi:hypothetical protein B7P34_34355 [Streptosporangium nondiastaticum]|uniref:DUF4328 domain-containing protein n=1 Tax=Streptosporangium nondiastaticum TaxID=35764 RepID=A0A9X7PDU4_9ACTN|nr:DUF4328 domain-containing protein [Streptosporangium nondiastaticum]PSJ24262.1 hypothetical protein B7P34_34355 [Streptosporangium nondiastaticum]
MYPCGNCRAAAVGPDGRCAACGVYQQQAAAMAPGPAPAYPYAPAMPAAPMPVGGVDLRRGLRIGLMTALGMSTAALLFVFWTDTQTRMALQDMLDNGVTSTTQQDLEDTDAAATVASLVYLLTLAASATLWAVWFRRARINAEFFAPGGNRLGIGWAAGAWFTPVVNFWFPKQIVNDIYKSSALPGARVPKGLVNSWWTLWIGSGVCTMASSGLSAGAATRIAAKGYDGSTWRDDVEALKNAATVSGLATLLMTAAGVLALLVVRQLGGLQERRAMAGPAGMPGMPGAPGGPVPAGVPYGAPGYVPGQQPGGPVAGWPHPPQNPYGSGPAGY